MKNEIKQNNHFVISVPLDVHVYHATCTADLFYLSVSADKVVNVSSVKVGQEQRVTYPVLGEERRSDTWYKPLVLPERLEFLCRRADVRREFEERQTERKKKYQQTVDRKVTCSDAIMGSLSV